MSDNIPPPPKPKNIVTAAPDVNNNTAGGVDAEFAGVNHVFTALSAMPLDNPPVAEQQRTEEEMARLAAETEKRLTSLAQKNLALVHSAAIQFKELRFYDASRLRMYAQDTYQKLMLVIGSTPTVPMIVKENLPDFNFLSFPIMLDPNLLITEIEVSIFHEEPTIEVVFDLRFRDGRMNSYSNRFKYR